MRAHVIRIQWLPVIRIIFVTITAHHPEQQGTDKYDYADNDHPEALDELHCTINQARLGTCRCANNVSWRRVCNVVRHGIYRRIFDHVVDVAVGNQALIINGLSIRIVRERIVEVTLNSGEFITQLCQLIVTNLNQRLLLRHIRSLEFGDPLVDFIFTRLRFIVGKQIRLRLRFRRQRVGIIAEVLIRRYERQARAR